MELKVDSVTSDFQPFSDVNGVNITDHEKGHDGDLKACDGDNDYTRYSALCRVSSMRESPNITP